MAPLNAAPRAVSKTSLGLITGPVDPELRTTTCFGFVINCAFNMDAASLLVWGRRWFHWMGLVMPIPKLDNCSLFL